LRLRLPSIRSRFGVDLSDYSRFLTAAECFTDIPSTSGYGIHFHFASDVCGPSRWFELLDEAIEWAGAIAEVVGAGPALLDMGGGWHREDFLEILLPSLSSLQGKIRRALPSVERVILEPGKAMLTCTAMLVSDVLEVRRLQDDKCDVVVDASIADLPMAALYAHPAVLVGADGFRGWLTGGSSRILGGICMEIDVLARGVSFPRVPAIGDKIVFLDAGGYDASMAWSFANGTSRDDRPR
jgi:diaminopimelate decarboxylase